MSDKPDDKSLSVEEQSLEAANTKIRLYQEQGFYQMTYNLADQSRVNLLESLQSQLVPMKLDHQMVKKGNRMYVFLNFETAELLGQDVRNGVTEVL